MKHKYITLFFSLALTFGSSVSLVFATMSSPNYKVQSDVVGSFGGDAASSNFLVNGTGGETIVGAAAGTSSQNNAGYWQQAPVQVIPLPSATFSVNVVNDYFVKITGIATYPGTLTIHMNGNDNNGAVSKTYGPITVQSNGTFQFTTDALNEGSYLFDATIVTPNGSANAVPSGSATADIKLDVINDFSITIDSAGNAIVTGQGFPNSEVKIKILDAQGNVIDTISDTTDANGDFSKTISGLAPGEYTIKVAAVDQAVQVGPYDAVKKIVIAETQSSTFSVNVVNTYQAVISGLAPYPGTVTITMTGVDALGNAISQTFGPIDVQSDGTFRYTTTNLGAGHYTFAVISTTSAGTSALSPNGDVSVDIVLGKPQNVIAVVRTDGKIAVSGESFPAGKVEIIIRNSSGDIVFQDVISVDASGHFESISLESFPVGTYTITATLIDSQGSKSLQSETKTITINAIPQEVMKSLDVQNATPLNTTIPQSAEGIDNNIRSVSDAIVTVSQKIAQAIKDDSGFLASVVAATAAAAAITPVVLGSAALNTVVPSIYRFLDFIGRSFFGLFGGKRRRAWGVVYDGSNGKPIPTAVVSLYNVAKGNVIETKITDKYGSYYFFVLPGEYEIKVKKEGFALPQSLEHASIKAFYSDMYLSGTLTLTQEDIIHKDIPLISDARVKSSFTRIFMQGVGKLCAITIFYGGFLLSLYMAYKAPSNINIALVVFYVCMLMMRNLFLGEPRPGRALNIQRKPLPFVWIKILNKKTGEREARVITDENGKYFMILNEGEYSIDAASVDNTLHASQDISFARRKPLDSDIILHP